MPKCRYCGAQIDKGRDEWVMPSNLWYYHKFCYEKMRNDKNVSEDIWIEKIYDFIAHDLKVKYNYFMCEKQREAMLKKKYTNKGIFFALKYFYEVKRGDWERGGGGIGIIPYVYEDSKKYWAEHAAIVQQISRGVEEANVKRVNHKAKKKKEKWSLDEI